MATSNNSSGSSWGYLIRPDKSATTQLEDLCIGLAKIIQDLEPGPDSDLTPVRIAAFYRAVGGNYDTLFLKTTDHGLSFMYRTLGCYHSLQPTANPFDTPSIPCLTPSGFARWQTIQILLCPSDHVPFLQKAVQIYDIPRPDGGYFPKNIPAECFPSEPDREMDRWHKKITGSLNQDNYVRRIKMSPYQSPHTDPYERRDGYFGNGHNFRPERVSRTNSHEEEQARLSAYRRRSSVPEVVSSPPEGVEKGSHWDPATKQKRAPRSRSAQRPEQANRPSSSTANAVPQQRGQRPSYSPPDRRHGSLEPSHSSRPASQQLPYQNYRHRLSGAHTPSTLEETSGSEASSETSNVARRSRPRVSDEERKNRKNSLWPPSFFKSHKRRHSSDASYRTTATKAPPLPLRPEYYPPKPRKQHPPMPILQSPHRPSAGVRFNDHIFENAATNSSPETPVQPRPNFQAPVIRYPEPPSAWHAQQNNSAAIGQPLTRESSGSSGTDKRAHSEWQKNAQNSAQQSRKAGAPVRVATVTGVGGRKYANTEQRHAHQSERQRAQMRGSLPTPV